MQSLAVHEPTVLHALPAWSSSDTAVQLRVFTFARGQSSAEAKEINSVTAHRAPSLPNMLPNTVHR